MGWGHQFTPQNMTGTHPQDTQHTTTQPWECTLIPGSGAWQRHIQREPSRKWPQLQWKCFQVPCPPNTDRPINWESRLKHASTHRTTVGPACAWQLSRQRPRAQHPPQLPSLLHPRQSRPATIPPGAAVFCTCRLAGLPPGAQQPANNYHPGGNACMHMGPS